ncbi:glycoside hydrolase family 71/99-like protein [uncultured Aquimarina sp.]|uniref:glycoside hydrolase family 71/99-like protein n=1 Tax=uncultured Aquimarina sp. TaxID=575652 RepID=UPI00260A3AB5|nr:glycoside hydrolase family 71/99-like protein [uncultured Aquimarina sp.]
MKLQPTIKAFLMVALMIFIYSCEKEEFPSIEPEQTVPQRIQDTTYTDAQLKKVLEEEAEIIKLEKSGYVADISGMDVAKDNPKKVYMHYMPWFQSKDYDGYWGQHWTMTNKNPDITDSNGKQEIASYFYPVIGPYSSNDPDLHEYHFLMMKLAGIDGVIFDWYGSKDLYDYENIKSATESFIEIMEDLDFDFSIMYEDRVAKQAYDLGLSNSIIEAAQEDFTYINNTYFTSPNYIKHNDKNLLFVFGPHHITTQQEWDTIFDILPTDNRPDFLTLWAANNLVGQNATGEFLWVDQDHLLAHEHYYNNYDTENLTIVGSSYPGFDSFYAEGGWSEGINLWSIDHNQGQTFAETLNYTHHEIADFIQLITWNDFGEGTMIEPTEEFGFMYLQLLQQYTGVDFTTDDLIVALDLYTARKYFSGNQEAQDYLDRTYKYIKQLNLVRADKIIKAVYKFYS